MQKHSVQCNNVQCSIFSVDSLINQTMMAQRCVLHIFFNQKCFPLDRGYLAEKIFHRGYITEKRLRTTGLSHGIELGEDEMRMDQDDHPPIPAGWNSHITALRRRELIHQLYQQYKNKCTHVHIFFRMFYLGTFVQRTLNSDRVRQQLH